MPKRKRENAVDKGKLLREAVQRGDYKNVRALLQDDADGKVINDQPVSSGWAALQCAIGTRNLEMVKLLVVEHKADVNIQSNSGFTPLQRACEYRHYDVLEIVKLLIHVTNLQVKSADGKTPLHTWIFHWACDRGHLEILKILIEKGFNDDLHSEYKYGNTPLHTACECRHLDIVQWLVVEQAANLGAFNNDGHSPLQYACLRDRLEIIRFLIENGANVHSEGRSPGWTLRWACAAGRLEIIQFLVDRNLANLTQKNGNNGETPLHWAVYSCVSCKPIPSGDGLIAEQNRRLVVMQYLMENDADINVRDNGGRTPLHRAFRHGRWKAAKFLFENGADLNAKDNDGKTPLHWVAKEENFEAMEHDFEHMLEILELMLANNGADLNVKDNDGKTPLHRAIMEHRFEIAKFLIRNGANLAANDNDGSTPLHLACDSSPSWGRRCDMKKILEAAKMLMENGADLNARDNDGNTPLLTACGNPRFSQMQLWEVVNLLLDNGGADLNAKDKNGKHALFWLCGYGDLDVVELLVKRGANPDVTSIQGHTPLQVACGWGYSDIVWVLVRHCPWLVAK